MLFFLNLKKLKDIPLKIWQMISYNQGYLGISEVLGKVGAPSLTSVVAMKLVASLLVIVL